MILRKHISPTREYKYDEEEANGNTFATGDFDKSEERERLHPTEVTRGGGSRKLRRRIWDTRKGTTDDQEDSKLDKIPKSPATLVWGRERKNRCFGEMNLGEMGYIQATQHKCKKTNAKDENTYIKTKDVIPQECFRLMEARL